MFAIEINWEIASCHEKLEKLGSEVLCSLSNALCKGVRFPLSVVLICTFLKTYNFYCDLLFAGSVCQTVS